MFEDIYLVNDDVELIEPEVIDELEVSIGCRLPRGYREILTKLGVGTYCDLINLITPKDVIDRTAKQRELWGAYYDWERGGHILSLDRAKNAYLIAQSIDGDDILLHPEDSSRLFVLPRHNDTVYWLDSDFSDPLAWQSEDGPVNQPPPFRYFEPYLNCAQIELFTARRDLRHDMIISILTEQLSRGGEQRLISEDGFNLLFIKAVGARIQLTSAPGDERIGIMITFSGKHVDEVNMTVKKLVEMDFFETNRAGLAK